MGGKIEGYVLDILTLRCLLDFQADGKVLDMWICNSKFWAQNTNAEVGHIQIVFKVKRLD